MSVKISKSSFESILDLVNLDSSCHGSDLKCGVDSILGWVECLNKINTEDVKELVHLFNESYEVSGNDSQKPLNHQDVLSNASSKNSNYIVVPAVK